MPRGPLGGPRPGAKSVLKLEIKETPVPDGDSDGVFPDPLIRAGAEEKEIMEDISNRSGFQMERLSIDKSVSRMRGLGETRVYTIMVDVSNMDPSFVAEATEILMEAGYRFSDVGFE